ncbi:MraY family glycosyltransferase [Pedobacter terrae]|uniref:MraY family glycosyltransferase n=1 Tax=Pedobacter terrae TaxID=405671 RepID=UPI002FF99626
MNYFLMIAFFAILLIVEVLFFRIAKIYDIVDRPNHRSSHSSITIRGGGIIFCFGALLFFLSYGFQYPFFMLGLILISLISFWDDISSLSSLTRIAVHLTSVGLLFFQLDILQLGWYWIPILLVLVIGSLNAYNFMDGINGITGSYSLITIGTLFYMNQKVAFTSANLLLILAMSVVIFNFFNFRKKAVCFAGDVGSVGIAFVIIFLIGQLMLKTHNVNYVLFLLLYGLDTGSTILFRMLGKENIFEPHKKHFYQYLTSKLAWSHLSVAMLYSVTQAMINVVLIGLIGDSIWQGFLFAISALICFIAVRFNLEGRLYLTGR